MPNIDELRRALQALAQPAALQFQQFPDYVVIGKELRLSFYEALQKLRASGTSLSSQQASSIADLEAYLTELSGPYDEALWCNPSALQRDSRWQSIRELAKAALDALA